MTTAVEVQNRHVGTKNTKYQVKVRRGSVIKFGRVRFRVKELVTQRSSTHSR